jgi:hypothetical protein
MQNQKLPLIAALLAATKKKGAKAPFFYEHENWY